MSHRSSLVGHHRAGPSDEYRLRHSQARAAGTRGSETSQRGMPSPSDFAASISVPPCSHRCAINVAETTVSATITPA